jgi:hypothetical protein
MKLHISFWSRLSIELSLVVLLVGCGGDYGAELKSLREEAARKAREEAVAKTDPAEVAEALGYTWPVPVPEETVEQIRAKVNELVTERVEEEYPADRVQKLRDETEEKYKLFPVGSNVRFIVNDGQGVAPIAEGLYQGKDRRGRYKIGERAFHVDEFKQADLARIDPEVHDRVVETEFRQKLFLFKENRKDFGAKKFAEIYSAKLREEGYTEVDGKWIAISSLIKNEMAERIETLAKKIEPGKQQEILSEAGYTLKDGEWKPTLRKRILNR